jgi:hypothetical protein
VHRAQRRRPPFLSPGHCSAATISAARKQSQMCDRAILTSRNNDFQWRRAGV